MNTLRFLALLVSITISANALGQTVYTTKTGEKYHKGSCRYLKNSKLEISLKDAKQRGYLACKVCKPRSSVSTNTALSPKPQSTKATKKVVATQCTGKTKSGKRCKRKTKNANGRCYQH